MAFPREAIAFENVDEPLRFQITDFFVPEADRSKKELATEKPDYSVEAEEFSVLLYGCTEQGNSVCAKVINYRPYFYLRVPDYAAKSAALSNDLKNRVSYFIREGRYRDTNYNYERSIIPKRFQTHLVGIDLVHRKEFMGFTNNAEFPFLKITVKSLGLFNSLKYFFQRPPKEFLAEFKEPFKLYESNIDPMLRFIHDHNILPCGWVELPALAYSIHEEGIDFARTNYCVQIDHEDIVPLNKNNTAPLLIASFDIECTSSHGDFPVAIKDYLKLAKDLVEVARYAKYSIPELKLWILQAYEQDVMVNSSVKIHRLYAKKNPKTIEDKHIESLYALLQEIQEVCEDSSDDEENKPVTSVAAHEFKVCGHLNTFLPPLHGDAIIQIGTTVHRYGSDEIIYKNLISLKSCDPIPGVDVQSYKTESEVLYAWRNLIQCLDPDILLGYNIFGFDMPYIWDRAKELKLTDFGLGLGRQGMRRCNLRIQNLSSAALGDNVLKYFDLDGVVMVDMYKVMQRTPLDSYKLDFVANLYLGDQKNDIKPHEIFEKFKGDSADRKEIAEYCIQDCALVNRLFHKLKVLENNNAMGNVCLVPLSYLFMRGQGVKIFSLVAQFCKNKNYVIPVLKGFQEKSLDDEGDGYEGAIVLNPKEGMYLEDAITVLDYSSLYPSSMIERNLSHDCYINDPKYDNLPGVDYCTVSYDLYEGIGDKKVKIGEKHCKFVQLPNGEKGLIPQILMKLLKQRKNTRKKIEYETLYCSDGRHFSGVIKETGDKFLVTDVEKNETSIVPKDVVCDRKDTFNTFEKLVFDALQLAYKITANSLYGQIGSRVSPIYLKDIAACTTATGRERILMAKSFVEEQYGAEVIYGDSVMPYTPITYIENGTLKVSTFQDLHGEWKPYEEFKPNDSNRSEKEQCFIPIWVWTSSGWSAVRRIIRHKTVKKIYRVITNMGIVDVTADHSLLDAHERIIKPEECKAGTRLLHFPPVYENSGTHLFYGKITFNNQREAQQYCVDLNNRAKVTYQDGCYIIEPAIGPFRETVVQEIIPLLENYEGYVYDVETVAGSFHAGIGSLIVKNTDSIFIKFPFRDEAGNPIKGKETLGLGIKAGQRASQEIKSILPPPQSLEYEKTFFPFIIFSKKRYVGLLYEDDPDKKPKQKSMGIVLKRRDNAPLVKKIYGGIIDILLTQYDLNKSVDFLKTELKKLVGGGYPLEDLIITKTLRGSYKDRTKIAHCVLADRMGERDPGNKPQINDRIPYVYVQVGPNVKLQGDKIEHPDYVREKQLNPDYQFYITNQLMKPICQLYALCVERLPDYTYSPGYWMQWDEELQGSTMYVDPVKRKNRIDALKEQEVENLLFNPFLENKRKVRTLACNSTTPVKKKKPAQIDDPSIKDSAPKLSLKITEDKETKVFKWESEFCMNRETIWNKSGQIPKAKLTKTSACNKVMYDVLKELVPFTPTIKDDGLILSLDKYYSRVLRDTIIKQEEILVDIEKAKKEADIAAFMECTEMLSTMKIANFLYQFKHKFV